MYKTQMLNGKEVPLTKEELKFCEQKELRYKKKQEELAKTLYQRNRKDAHKPIGDYLDMLWHAMDTGEIPKAKEFYDTIAEVKKNFPKYKE